jgi:hypothetical protein
VQLRKQFEHRHIPRFAAACVYTVLLQCDEVLRYVAN